MRFQREIKLSAEEIAQAFCDLDDEDQAQVIIEIGKIADGWGSGAAMQWWLVGKHLRTCACSTESGRHVIEEIHSGLEEQSP